METTTARIKYHKPTIRVVEWDFNESICNSVITNSFNVNTCIKAKARDSRYEVLRKDSEELGDWHWTGSN
jgi:hypothetical protein